MDRSSVLGLMAALCLLTGCQANESSETAEEDVVGIAESTQLDNGTHGWLRYVFTFEQQGLPFCELLVIGPQTLGDFRENTEFWYVENSNLSLLGNQDLVVTTTYGSTNPPSISGDQEFTQPVFGTWNRFTSDPVSGGRLYDFGNRHLRIGTNSGGITRLTWYQTIPSANAAENINLDALLDAGTGNVTVPSGQDGYYIDATIN